MIHFQELLDKDYRQWGNWYRKGQIEINLIGGTIKSTGTRIKFFHEYNKETMNVELCEQIRELFEKL